MRTAPPALEERFRAAVVQPSDINEHLELLRELASKCDHVTEFGLRGANGSTIALLAGQPKTFITWDINPRAVVNAPVQELIGMAGDTIFQPRCGDTLLLTMEQTDLLFIDTWHTHAQLRRELERHGMRVNRYLAFHDTESFRYKGEDGTEPGLCDAIRWFQQEHFPEWSLIHDRDFNNGLAVLERNR